MNCELKKKRGHFNHPNKIVARHRLIVMLRKLDNNIASYANNARYMNDALEELMNNKDVT